MTRNMHNGNTRQKSKKTRDKNKKAILLRIINFLKSKLYHQVFRYGGSTHPSTSRLALVLARPPWCLPRTTGKILQGMWSQKQGQRTTESRGGESRSVCVEKKGDVIHRSRQRHVLRGAHYALGVSTQGEAPGHRGGICHGVGQSLLQ